MYLLYNSLPLIIRTEHQISKRPTTSQALALSGHHVNSRGIQALTFHSPARRCTKPYDNVDQHLSPSLFMPTSGTPPGYLGRNTLARDGLPLRPFILKAV